MEVKPNGALMAFAIVSALMLASGCTDSAVTQSSTGSQSRPLSRFRDRQEFAKLMSSINKGMTDAEVIRILGKPDVVLTGKEMDANLGSAHGNIGIEEWYYGIDADLSFPTLGTVYFRNDNGRKVVACLFGQKGTPPPTSLFAEKELRKLVSLIAQCGKRPRTVHWNPVWGIKVVNTLQPLGKDKALAAIEEFSRVTPWF